MPLKQLVWFRSDLRVEDNPALRAAAEVGPVVACFLEADAQWRSHHEGPRKTAFVRRSVRALASDLAALGTPLLVRKVPWFADAPATIVELMQETGATHLHFDAEYPLNEVKRDRAVWRAVTRMGRQCTRHEGSVMLRPGHVLTNSGRPFTVFTPFKRRWFAALSAATLEVGPAPDPQGKPIAPLPMRWGEAVETDDTGRWPAGSRSALAQLDRFCLDALQRYQKDRDFPGVEGTSRLSPHLAAGTISPRQVLKAVGLDGPLESSAYVNELVWRDFYRHVIAAFPHVSRGGSFHPHYDHLRWEQNPAGLEAWKSAQTGYPLVDAAMRQLTSTGWMHNRLRMVAAMFLCKHLLIDWREGERFFMEQLVDADFAANNGGWQWSASTGTDAVPYFRVFNPELQGQRFDPDGTFTRRMVPELGAVPNRFMFNPWKSGLILNYPRPIIDHGMARLRAIDRFRNAQPNRFE